MKNKIILILITLILFTNIGCKKNEVIQSDNVTFLTVSEINEYLNMTVREIIELSNLEFDTSGTLAILESHMTFPCIYPENLPVYFICRN